MESSNNAKRKKTTSSSTTPKRTTTATKKRRKKKSAPKSNETEYVKKRTAGREKTIKRMPRKEEKNGFGKWKQEPKE